MRRGKPSQTAAFVAMTRALADAGLTTTRGFSDPYAYRLLRGGWRRLYEWLVTRIGDWEPQRRSRALSGIDVFALRVLAIDRAVDDGVTSGCRQVVLLGAGLDTRAYRMHTLASCTVFEVDHPSTQAVKRERAATFQPVGKRVYVEVDFERDDLGERLERAGHRADEPTVWIWEGVVMYLSDEALAATLAVIQARSAQRSRTIVQYGEPGKWRKTFWLRLLFAWWGEPQIGVRTAAQMRAAIERAGLELVEDSGTFDWAPRFGAATPTLPIAQTTRMLVASPEAAPGAVLQGAR